MMWVGVRNTLVCWQPRHPSTRLSTHLPASTILAFSQSLQVRKAWLWAGGRRSTLHLSLLPGRLDCLPLGLNCAALSSNTQFPNFSIYGVRAREQKRTAYTSFAAEGRPESMRNSIDFARLLQERCARFARINLARRTNRKCFCTTGSFATGSKVLRKNETEDNNFI